MCVCIRMDAPSKSDPRQGVIHDFITQALHKALSNTPPFLSGPLCFFPMLPLFPTAFFTLCFLCPLCYFTILQTSMLSLAFFPLSSVDLHHFCPYLLLVFFDFISILNPFSCSRLLFTPCLSFSASFLSPLFFFAFLPLFFLSVCKIMQKHKSNL